MFLFHRKVKENMLELAKDFIEKGVWVVFCDLDPNMVANRWDVRFDPGLDKKQIIVLNLKLVVDEGCRKALWDALILGEERFQEVKDSLNHDLCYPLPDLVMIYYVLYQRNINEWKGKTITIDEITNSKGRWVSQLMFKELMQISQNEAREDEEE